MYQGEEELSPNVLAAIEKLHTEGAVGVSSLGGLPAKMPDQLATCSLGKDADEEEMQELVQWLADAHTDAQRKMRLRTSELVQYRDSELYIFKKGYVRKELNS